MLRESRLKNTYRRLCRIKDLAGYMAAFEACIDKMPGPEDSRQGRSVIQQIYSSFFFERIRYASPGDIRTAAEDMQKSMYAPAVCKNNPVVFHMLENGQYNRVWLHNAIRRVRHWAAVRIKYLLSFRRL